MNISLRKLCWWMQFRTRFTCPTLSINNLIRSKAGDLHQSVWPMTVGRTFAIRRKDYAFPTLNEEELEEDFVRGSGPGGQSVNKTSNCVVLKHTPTGIVVKCHETRSLHENRKKARERIQEKIDHLLRRSESFLGQQQAEAMRDKSEKKQKARNRLAMKKAFKEREGLD